MGLSKEVPEKKIVKVLSRRWIGSGAIILDFNSASGVEKSVRSQSRYGTMGQRAIVKVQAKDRMALCDSEVIGINRNGWPRGRLIKRRILWVAGTYEDQEKERERPGWYPGSEMSR